MANDTLVLKKSVDVARRHGRDLLWVEAVKDVAKFVALAKDRQPTQARLKTLQANLLKQPHIIGDRPSPLPIVILDILRIVATPPTAGDAIHGANASFGRHG